MLSKRLQRKPKTGAEKPPSYSLETSDPAENPNKTQEPSSARQNTQGTQQTSKDNSQKCEEPFKAVFCALEKPASLASFFQSSAVSFHNFIFFA
jgi:hypothetical protein